MEKFLRSYFACNADFETLEPSILSPQVRQKCKTILALQNEEGDRY